MNVRTGLREADFEPANRNEPIRPRIAPERSPIAPPGTSERYNSGLTRVPPSVGNTACTENAVGVTVVGVSFGAAAQTPKPELAALAIELQRGGHVIVLRHGATHANQADLAPYASVPARIDLDAKNGPLAYGANRSMKMDFSEYDKIDDFALNEILWRAVKGADAPIPPAVRRAIAYRPVPATK